ncbi:MAG TPA: 6-phosphogluconolactonase [Tepidisphaeraceae bacterium]|jgi:6-phosphogluconolactonase|nr:6-phosphogluconolactonase [Tepidisphaeraceae bacterium]
MDRKIKVSPDVDSLIIEAAGRIVDAAETARGAGRKFSLALSGGKTPEGLYRILASSAYRTRIDWPGVEIYFGDERCVPPDSDQSNFRMANAALLSKVPIPGDQIHRMRGEIDPQIAAKEYGELLKGKFGDGGMDMILLGMGDDGHTASLFPHTAALAEQKHRCVANYVEKLKTWRVTMTFPFINRAAAVLILVAGKDKAARLSEVLEGPRDPDRLPIQRIAPETGVLTWLLDAGAAGMHEDE